MNSTVTKNQRRSSKSTPKSSQSQAKLVQSTIFLVEEKGFESVSLREICAHSKQNLASVSYHFGNKDALFDTIIKGYYIDLAEAWQQNLSEYLRQPENQQPRLVGLLRCLIQPYVMLDNPSISLKLHRSMHTRCMMQPKAQRPLESEHYRSTLKSYTDAIVAACPQLSSKEANRLILLSIGATINMLTIESGGKKTTPANKRLQLLDTISAFCASYATAGHSL